MALPQPTLVGRGGASYLHFPSLLTEKDLVSSAASSAGPPRDSSRASPHPNTHQDKVRSHVDGSCVQGAIEEGILFTDVGANRDRNSKVSWLERPSTADEGEPTVPEWLHTRLRKAAAATHERYGDKLCPVGVSKLGRWVSPRTVSLASSRDLLAQPRAGPRLAQGHAHAIPPLPQTPKYEPIQYTEYPAGSHYGAWHTDGDVDEVDPEDTRAVTIVVLLAAPGVDFEGGHFEVEVGGKKSRVGLQAGDAIGFPAKRLYHRVTKITSGLRRSMVFWVSRPGKDPPARYGSEVEVGVKAKAKAKRKAKKQPAGRSGQSKAKRQKR